MKRSIASCLVILGLCLCACGNTSTTTGAASSGGGASSASTGGSTGSVATTAGASTGVATGATTGTQATTGASGTTSGACPTTLTDGGLPSAPTWCNFTLGFVDTYCVRCHQTGGEGLPYDFTTYQGVYDAGGLIRCGTCILQDPSWGCGSFPPAEQFPIAAPYPSDAGRSEIVLWITNGAPQN